MRVPTYDEQQVERRGATDARFVAADFSASGDAVAAGLSRAAGAAERIEALNETLAVADVKKWEIQYSTFEREVLHNPETGFYAKQGEHAVKGYADVETALKEKRRELVSIAKDKRVRDLLGDVLDRRLDASLTGVERHAQAQTDRYADDLSRAREIAEIDNAAAAYDDPEALERSLHTVRDEVMSRGERKGMPVELSNMEAAVAVSTAHAKIVDRLALDDPDEAKRYLDIHEAQIVPSAKTALDKLLDKPLRDTQAERDADAEMGLGTAVPHGPTDLQSLVHAVTHQESRGRDAAVSNKGALGRMQLMPATARAEAASLGIAFDETKLRTDAAYNTKLGTSHLSRLLERYGGNTTLALAAYNAGPGAVDNWVRTIGDPRKGGLTDAQFAARIPYKETRAYVPGVLKNLGSVGPKYSPRDDDLGTLLNNLHSRGYDPDREKDAARAISARVAMNERMLRDRERGASDQAWALFDRGGAVPLSLVGAMSTEQRRSLEAAQDRRNRGDDAHTDPVKFVELTELARTQPERFAAADLNQLRGKFSPGDIRSIGALQVAIRKAGAAAPLAVANERIVSVTRERLEAAGITTVNASSPKRRAAAASQIMEFHNKVAADVAAYVAEKKVVPDDLWIQARADRWLLQVTLPEGRDKAIRLFEAKPGTPIDVTVPASARTRILAAARRNGIQSLTDKQIADAYVAIGP